MTMFTELYALALHATLTMTVSADEKTGKLTINVIPKPRGDTNDAALSTPLALTAPPAEFDEGFVEALSGFRAGHVSLAKQARDTAELLAAATAASASKGTKAVAKASSKLPVARAAATPVRRAGSGPAQTGRSGRGRS